MKILKNVFQNELNIRTQMDFPIKGIEFIDITPLFLQKETFKEMIDLFVAELEGKKIDYILAPEARGFLLGSAIALRLGIGCIPVRKRGKLPESSVRGFIEYKKEYGKDILELPKLINDDYDGKRFYIVDDIYATGNTMKAVKKLIKNLGGKLVGEAAIINIKELNKNKKIFSLIDVNEG